MSVEHYENFPVASLLLPAHLRPAVATIYRFARSADDFADEGDLPATARLAALDRYTAELQRIECGALPQTALFRELAGVIAEYEIPVRPFHELLSAFRQDVAISEYPDFDTLGDYCRRSANPVGALMLHLYRRTDPANLRDSDAICTALQLINFWQDVAIDLRKARIYLPQSDMARFGVTEAQIGDGIVDDAWRRLMSFEIDRARMLLLSGAPLAHRLPGRIGWELRLVVQGGLRILHKIEQADYDVFRRRPQLTARDWLPMVAAAMRMH